MKMDVIKGCLDRLGKAVGLALCIVALAACGGGGGSGKSKDAGTPPPNTATKLTANAGVDRTVNTGDRVDLDPKVLVANGTSATLNASGLELKGSSDNKEAIVSLVWTKIEGPDIALRSSGFNDGKINFIAPSVSGASSIKITFRLTLTNAAALSAEDTVTITVNRVNQPPTANAGDDLSVIGGETVNLNASSSADIDGIVSRYQWSQTSGASVDLAGAATAQPTFTAPLVAEEASLEFELSVEDNEGKKSVDRVRVVVVPRDIPSVHLHFPPAQGIYTDTTISAFGSVAATGTSSITSLTVDSGNGPIAVDVQPNGNWRLEALALPSGPVAQVSIVVEATDSEGRKGVARSTLQTSSKVSLGTGQDWDDIVGMQVDSSTNRLWILSQGDTSIKLMSVNLNNGDRSVTVSDFNNSAQGVNTRLPASMTFDELTKTVYVSAAAGVDSTARILGIDTTTGMRSMLSDSGRGTGENFGLPWGLALGSAGNLFVADNHKDVIFSVDIASGNRTVIADASAPDFGIDAPLLLAQSKTDKNRLFMSPYTDELYVLELNVSSDPVTNTLAVSNFSTSRNLMGRLEHLAADGGNDALFLKTPLEGVVQVNISTGDVRTIRGPFDAKDEMTFDETRGVIYLIDEFPEELHAVDPVTGKSVIVSKLRDI